MGRNAKPVRGQQLRLGKPAPGAIRPLPRQTGSMLTPARLIHPRTGKVYGYQDPFTRERFKDVACTVPLPMKPGKVKVPG